MRSFLSSALAQLLTDGLNFQGTFQEERARHLQEDLNVSKEKFEKSLKEVR